MEPSQVIVLYSKYSPSCKPILHLTQSYMNNFRFICIDNEDVRKQIIESELSIRTVPCVLLKYPSGKFEKFESNNICQWITEQLDPRPLRTPLSPVPPSPPKGESKQVGSTPIDGISFEGEEKPHRAIKKKSITDIAAEMEAEAQRMALKMNLKNGTQMK